MKRRFPTLHPILIAVFPILFKYSQNMQEFPIRQLVTPVLYAGVLAGAAWAVLAGIMRDARKSGLLVSLFAILFFSYEHAVNLLSAYSRSGGMSFIGKPSVVLAVFVAVFAVGAAAVFRTKKDLADLAKIVNFVSVVLVAVPLFTIGSYKARNRVYYIRHGHTLVDEMAAKEIANSPDVFYIILDAYGRADNLAEIYGYDNTEMIEFLRAKGFYVADKAHSNYSHTRFSLSSSLNLEYLDELVAKVGEDYEDYAPVTEMTAHSKVRSIARTQGYGFVAFDNGFYVTTIRDADLFLRRAEEKGEFARGVMDGTPLVSNEDKSEQDRERVLYMLDALPRVGSPVKRYFVFAHIMIPHPPYIFNSSGGPSDIKRYYGFQSANRLICPEGITRSEAMRRYVDQVRFVNSKIKTVVNSLLERSPKPVIIIQGDHGSGTFTEHENIDNTYLADRMSILAAVYLPDGGRDKLYAGITPVNTLRLVMTEYFNEDLELLPDRSYFSEVPKPYKFYDVTDEIGDEQDRLRYERLKAQDYFEVPAGAEETSRKSNQGAHPSR